MSDDLSPDFDGTAERDRQIVEEAFPLFRFEAAAGKPKPPPPRPPKPPAPPPSPL